MLAHARVKNNKIVVECREMEKGVIARVLRSPTPDQEDALSHAMTCNSAECGWNNPEVKDYFPLLADQSGAFLLLEGKRVEFCPNPYIPTVQGAPVIDPVQQAVNQLLSKPPQNQMVPKHDHPAHLLYDDGKGLELYIGQLKEIDSTAYDLVLDLTGAPRPMNHKLPEEYEWLTPLLKNPDDNVMYLEIRDYDIPELDYEFWSSLWLDIRSKTKRVVVGCMGGHGRSGMVCSILLSFATGMAAEESIRYIRQNYCHEVVETALQESYVHFIVSRYGLERAA